MNKVLVIGGGISGLTAAYLLSQNSDIEVHIVEKDSEVGGLLKSFYYEEAGYFDYGAHNILETQIKEIDDLFLNLLPKDEWQISNAINGQRRALTGLIYEGSFRENSPFIDLRNNENLDAYILDFLSNITQLDKKNVCDTNSNAYELSESLFGQKITNDIINNVLNRLYNKDATELNAMVLYLTQLFRIGLFDESIMKELVNTKEIAKRLSYPEQKKLPNEFVNKQNAYYPKNYGIYRVIDALKDKLHDLGVVFHLNSEITEAKIENSLICDIKINDKSYNFDNVINSVGYLNLSKILNLNISDLKYDKPPKTVITNFLIDEPLNVDEVCFIYCYDEESNIFRIDNYPNYSEGAIRDNSYAIGIESLIYEEFDETVLQEKLISELIEYKLLSLDVKVIFKKTEVLDYGFPLLTQNNVNINNFLREKVKNLKLSNLTNIGIFSEKGLFFENDVVKDVYKKIMELRDGR